MPRNYKDEITRFYEKVDARKIKTVDALLAKYVGKEEQLLAALHKKYNIPLKEEHPPEAAPPAEPTKDAQEESDISTKAAVEVPETQTSPAVVAAKQVSTSYRDRLLLLYERYAPNRIVDVDSELAANKGKEEEFLKTVTSQYGAPDTEGFLADANADDYRERLVALYKTYAPSKLHKVDMYLQKYQGREASLLKAVETKLLEHIRAASEGTNTQTNSYDAYKKRLQAVYKQYAPRRLNRVDHDLQKYPGREEDVIAAAIKKYGPPTADDSHSVANLVSFSNTVMDDESRATATATSVDGRGNSFAKAKAGGNATRDSSPDEEEEEDTSNMEEDAADAEEEAAEVKDEAQDVANKIEPPREKAETEARAKAEDTVRAKAAEDESRTKAKADARQKAEEAARAKAEEEEEKAARAKAEAVEAARAAAAEQQARVKAEEEEAARARAKQEAREKAEAEARARAEKEEAARQKAEEESKAEVRARAEAEEESARAKAEQEARAKADEEAASIRAEEEAARRRGMEEKEEMEAREKAESEARAKAEKEAARLKAQEEEEAARSKATKEARIRAEAEAEAARMKAEREAREEAEKEAARIRAIQEEEEAAARAKANEEAAARAKAQKDAEAQAKAEADVARAKAEEEARARAEEKARAKAEMEEARAKADKAARAKSEERKARAKSEEAARVKAEEVARTKAAEETRAVEKKKTPRKTATNTPRPATEEEIQRAKVAEEEKRLNEVNRITYQFQTVLHDFFRVLGTTVVDGTECLERSVYTVLWDTAALDPAYMCTGDMVTEKQFIAAVQSFVADNIALMERATEKMSTFIKQCREKVVNANKASHLVSHELRFGFWTYRCVQPSVVPSWKRCWATLSDDFVLALCVPHSTRSQMDLPFERIASCQMEAAVNVLGVPKHYARNGVTVKVTEGPDALQVLLCPEQTSHAQALVRAYRKWKKLAANLAPSPSPARGKSVSCGLLEDTPVAVADLAFYKVWCCRSGSSQFFPTHWTFARGVVLHHPYEDERVTYLWDLSTVEEIVRIHCVPVPLPHNLKEVLCFVVRCRGGKTIFCCCETLKIRNRVMAKLQQYLLRKEFVTEVPFSTDYPKRIPGKDPCRASRSTTVLSMNSSMSSATPTPTRMIRPMKSEATSPAPRVPLKF